MLASFWGFKLTQVCDDVVSDGLWAAKREHSAWSAGALSNAHSGPFRHSSSRQLMRPLGFSWCDFFCSDTATISSTTACQL